MGEMGEAFRKAGYNPRRRPERGRGRPDRPHGRQDAPDRSGGGRGLPRDCLLDSYYNEHGQLRREIFVEIPEKLAATFQQHPDPVKASAMRKFYECVRTVREMLIQEKSFEACKPDLYRLKPLVRRQKERRVVSEAFVQFIDHNIDLAVQSPENLKGFHRLFESVICYSKEK